MSVKRFRRSNPCPVCGGFDEAKRGTGTRCHGFLSDDGEYAHCSREEKAGNLAPEAGGTFAHRLVGDCKCGANHDPKPIASAPDERRIVARYQYRDEAGDLLFEVVRYTPKSFKQRRPDGRGSWIWNLNGTRRVLLRLPEVIAAVEAGITIHIGEGEKDVEAVFRAGGCATCNPGGAGKWPMVAEHAREVLRGAHVRIVADRDAEGRKHARDIVASLTDVVASLELLEPAVGKDIAEHLGAGRTLDELVAVVAEEVSEPATLRRDSKHTDELATVRAADIEPVPVEWLWPARIARGFLNLLTGPAGVGKSTNLYDLAARVSREGGTVLVATAEDHLAAVVRPRLEAARADLSLVEIVTDEFHLPADAPKLEARARSLGAVLITADPLVCFIDARTDSYKDPSVRQALQPLGGMAERLDAAVVVVLHTNKAASDDPLFRIGGSGGFVAAARHVLLCCGDPEDETGARRVLAVVKSNLSAFPPPLAYTVAGVTISGPRGEIPTSRIEWGDELPELDPRSLLAHSSLAERGALRDAIDFLGKSLEAGPLPASEVIADAKKLGISEPTLRRARRACGVKTRKDGLKGHWIWEAATEGVTEDVNPMPDALTPSPRPAETHPLPPEGVTRQREARPNGELVDWRNNLTDEQIAASVARLGRIAEGEL
jgi:putative DNA primase/helicase